MKIYLPRLLGVDEVVDQGESAPVDRVKRDRSILVVEDDDDVRAYTVEILRELGYRVLEARDGPSALRLIERQDRPIDLMFTDVVMPGMSGRELADRARAAQPELKIICTSGYTRNAIVHGGRLEAGVEVIAKPFTYQALAEKVVDVLEAGGIGRILLVADNAGTRTPAFSRPPQRSDRARQPRASWAHCQAHRRRRSHRIPSLVDALRDRGADGSHPAQRRLAA